MSLPAPLVAGPGAVDGNHVEDRLAAPGGPAEAADRRFERLDEIERTYEDVERQLADPEVIADHIRLVNWFARPRRAGRDRPRLPGLAVGR